MKREAVAFKTYPVQIAGLKPGQVAQRVDEEIAALRAGGWHLRSTFSCEGVAYLVMWREGA